MQTELQSAIVNSASEWALHLTKGNVGQSANPLKSKGDKTLLKENFDWAYKTIVQLVASNS